MKEKLTMIGKVLYGLVLTGLILVAAVVAISVVNIPGNIKLLVVQSGSMEPTIREGAIVVIKPQTSYQKEDIITIVKPANPKVSVTHRVVSVETQDGKDVYITKGDANNAADTEKRLSTDVVGKTQFSIPYLGFLVSFAKTKEGLILLIVIPAVLIVYSELVSLKNELVRLIKERESAPKKAISTKFDEITNV